MDRKKISKNCQIFLIFGFSVCSQKKEKKDD
jgi:hypothetical protein